MSIPCLLMPWRLRSQRISKHGIGQNIPCLASEESIWWLSKRLWYLQCLSNGDAAVWCQNIKSGLTGYMWIIYPYSSRLLHWHWGNQKIKTFFKWHFQMYENCIFIQISLKFVSDGPIALMPALTQVMAWCHSGSKPLPEPMLTRLTDAHKCHLASMPMCGYSWQTTYWNKHFHFNSIVPSLFF